ncbi:MAG: peptide ABC transporter substrate-binding protein [Spirochaetia bacterium]
MRSKSFGLFLILMCLAVSAVMAGGQKEQKTGTQVQPVTSMGTLPSDAVAPADQVMYYPLMLENGTYLDFMKTIYNCIQGAASYVEESLMGFDKDLKVIPLGATSWDISSDSLTWTFHLRHLKWSDGQPITAGDYVYALQRAAQEGYDFGWYWSFAAGIKNWSKVEKGESPVGDLGIKAADDYTLVITTDVPKPYLPGVLFWLFPVPQHAVKKYGDEYATKAETMVSSGPFMISEWVKGDHITVVQNPYYDGLWKPYLTKIVLKYGTWDPQIGFPAYQNNEIYRSDVNPGQLALTQKNMPDQLHSWPMFRIFYLSFDTTKPPFNDGRVRQAFSHAINREEITSTVLKGLTSQEYSLLMSGFPGYDPDQANKVQTYDVDMARKLMADAGYPGGKGFPSLELWVRNENQLLPWEQPLAVYLQAHLQDVLGVNLVPRTIEVKTFTDALNNHTQNFFLLAYQFDYVDPSNFMDLFITGGRHAWSDPNYDAMVRQADPLTDATKRLNLYHSAEQLLLQQAPSAFICQQQYSAVWKPFLKGPGVEPNDKGIASWGDMWTKYVMTHVYIAKH